MQYSRAQLPEVRHGEMLGWSVSPGSGSEWGQAPPDLANNGLKHQPALYSGDEGHELGGGEDVPEQPSLSWSRSWTEVLDVPGVGLEYSPPLPLTAQLLVSSSGY